MLYLYVCCFEDGVLSRGRSKEKKECHIKGMAGKKGNGRRKDLGHYLKIMFLFYTLSANGESFNISIQSLYFQRPKVVTLT